MVALTAHVRRGGGDGLNGGLKQITIGSVVAEQVISIIANVAEVVVLLLSCCCHQEGRGLAIGVPQVTQKGNAEGGVCSHLRSGARGREVARVAKAGAIAHAVKVEGARGQGGHGGLAEKVGAALPRIQVAPAAARGALREASRGEAVLHLGSAARRGLRHAGPLNVHL